jgi:RNA polymerase sigma-70 factor (ECF subfamily)
VRLALHADFIKSAQAGEDGLERLITVVWPEFYRIAFAILHDAGLAEDAAQEACAAMARSLPTLRNSHVFGSWSYKIIVNHALTVARRRPRTQTLDVMIDHGIHDDRSDALDTYHAIAALPLEQRAAVVLHYYVGLKSSEIAAATGLPASTIRFHLMLARRALRKTLELDAQPPFEKVLSDV